jgi:hypothetical protein
VLRLTGHADQAVIEQQQAQKIRVALRNVPVPESAAALVEYALSESAVGNRQDARVQIDAAIAALAGMKSMEPQQFAAAFVAKARIELAQGEVADGCALAHQALSLSAQGDPTTGWRHAEAQSVYGECLAALRQPIAARFQLQAALAALEHVRGTDHWMTKGVRARLRALTRA